MQAHMAEADSDIFIGVGRNGLTFGVKVTDDAYSVTEAGMPKFAFLVKKVFRMSFAPDGIEGGKPPGEIVLRVPSLSKWDFPSMSVKGSETES